MFEEKIITKTGYVKTTVPFKFYNQLLENINSFDFTNQEFNYSLAGQIEKEVKFDPSQIPNGMKKHIYEGCEYYVRNFGHNIFSENPEKSKKYKFDVLNSWINFQKKTEYNPIHHHTSGDLVFVLWIQIPYELEEERKWPSSVKSNNGCASCFQFAGISNLFADSNNSLIEVDKSYEGKMIIFHSRLEHTVYPFFTSDEYRISMSGNIKIIFNKDE
jgi:hypothetical protein